MGEGEWWDVELAYCPLCGEPIYADDDLSLTLDGTEAHTSCANEDWNDDPRAY
jgi:hypothetical protein